MHALVAALGILVATGALATEPVPVPAPVPAPADGRIVRVFEIRYQDVQDVSLVLPSLLSDTTILTVDSASRTVTVVDRPELVQRVAEFLQQFDVPPHAVLVRIVLEKAQKQAPAVGGDGLSLAGEASGWKYSPLAETTLEVLERGQATQVVGDDGAFEIHVSLGTVDMARRVMRFDEVAVSRLDRGTDVEAVGPPSPPERREMFRTAVDLQDRVGKVIMAARNESSDVALVVRVLGLIRDDGDAGEASRTPVGKPALAPAEGR